MQGSRTISRPLTAFITAVATVAAYVGLSIPATPARAADLEVTKLVSLLDDVAGYVPRLAGVGKLGAAIPTLDVAPGGANGIGLTDLLGEARSSVLTTVDAADTLEQLKDAINGKSGSVTSGRNVSFTASTATTGTVKSLTVGVEASRTISSGRLDISDDSPQFSLASASGVRVVLDLDATFTLNYDTATQALWLTKNTTTPALTIGFDASLPTPANVTAGLGILGITLDGTTTFALNGVVSTTWSDPNNDGRLAFDEPGGTAGDGELAASGSGPGIVSAALTSGSMHAKLDIKATPSTAISLPAATATVNVDADNLVTDTPQVTFSAGALDAINPFLTLSTRDLAQALAQAASAVLALQDATGVKLPFMRGDLSNAVGAAEAIVKFLETNVPEPATGSVTPGLPSFTSLQDLLEKLQSATGLPGGSDMDVVNALYNAVDKKVRFDLNITRTTSATASALNPIGEPTTGGGGTVTYGDATLRDTSKNFAAGDGLGELALKGRQIVAGTSAAIIKGVKAGDVHTLELDPAPLTPPGGSAPTVLWQGGKPANGAAYAIAAADPKIGLVELGNALKNSGGIANATAKVASATVKPSYSLSIPFVLDLRAPDTSDCDPGSGTAACPFSHTENGITRIITSLPQTADRVMLGTGTSGVKHLLTADAPIDTAVEVDATVGFVGVKIAGSIKACTTNSAADCSGTTASGKHLLSIGIKSMVGNGADAAGDIPIPVLFDKLRAALAGGTLSSVVDFAVNGQAYASLAVSVPGAPAFFGSGTATVTVAMPNIMAPATLNVTAPTLDRLAALDVDPSNPLALFGALLSSLQSLQGVISSIPGGAAALDKKMPLLGRSFSELIGSGVSGGGSGVEFTNGAAGTDTTILTDPSKTFTKAFLGRRVAVGTNTAMVVDATSTTLTLKPAIPTLPAAGSQYAIDSELQGVINLLQQDPAQSLQEMLDVLEQQLGGGSLVDFAVDPPASAGDPPILKVNLDWKRSYSAQAPLNFTFDVGALGDQSMVGAKGTGALKITATGQVKLTLRLPLSAAAVANPAANLTIDPTASFVKAGVAVNGDGVQLQANLGPFKASLGNPDPNQPAGTQLQAGLGVELKRTGTTPVTVADFFGSGLGATVDGNGVSCSGAPVATGTKLALCAVFPAYLNGNKVNADDALNNFVVRLPVGSTLTDSFNLGGPAVGGQQRLVLPTGLETALANAALNLLTFGDGFFSYLEFLEGALHAASFEGKLPVIGKDLQAGSEFIGKLRADLTTAFDAAGVPTNPNAGAIRTFLNTKLDAALPNGSNPLTIDLTCTTRLAPVENKPGVTRTVGSGVTPNVDYRYKVVAYTNASKDAGPASPATDVVENAATLDNASYNTIQWIASQYATGYFILRQVEGSTEFKKIADVSGGATTSFQDKGASAGTAYTEETERPLVVPCPDGASPLEITGFTVAVDIGQGNVGGTGCTGTDCLSATLPLDLGIPGLSLKATDATGGITGAVGWKLHLKVGLSRDDGFYVATQDTNSPEFEVGASLKFPETTSAQLAFINVTAEDKDTTKPELAGRIAIDLRDENVAAADCTATCSVDHNRKLTMDKLASGSISDFVKPVLDAKVDIKLRLAAKVDSALPGISTDFLLAWAWTSDAPSDVGGLSIDFKNVTVDAGDLLGKTIKPIVQQVVDVYKPVQPVIDTIFAPIPVLSDLSKAVGGDEITIATLAQTFSTLAGGPDLQPFIDVLQKVRALVNGLNAACGSGPSCGLRVGDFALLKSKAVTTDANPGTAASLIDNGSKVFEPGTSLIDRVDNQAPGNLQGTGADPQHTGFSFPFLSNPSSIFGLIVGQDVELVEFDSGPLKLGFEFQKSFGPIYAPPPVNVVIGGGASVSMRVAAGFDTYGIRTAVEAGKVSVKILDSLYFKTSDSAGKPIPVVQFEGFLQAGASVSAVVIEVGIVGGIKLTVGFFWNDPNNDAKFRFGEFLATALSNPICLFNVGGELSLFIKVFITLGVSPFSVSFDFTLVNIKLLDFSLKPDCAPPPPRLGGTKDGVLYLYAGKFSGASHRGHDAWKSNNTADESWIVRQVPAKSPEPAKVVVQALGITEEFEDAGITTVVLDGRGYAGKLQVMFNGGDKTQPFTKKAVVFTGSGEDAIRTGEGESWIDAGSARDEITTTDRANLDTDPVSAKAARVAGGAGPDAISVGNAVDTVMGDGSLSTGQHDITVKSLNGADVALDDAINPATLALPSNLAATAGSDGDDQISAGLGGSKLYGNNGSDKIGTANDNPQADLAGIKGTTKESRYRARPNEIVGGGGSDRIKSGSANDTIWTGAKDTIDGGGFGSGDNAATDKNAVDTGTGSDTVYGSNAPDFVTTHSTTSQTATVFGGDSEDVLVGGAGTDKLYGGPGDDYLVAEPATVSDDKPLTDVLGSARRVTALPLGTASSTKTLVGGGGRDRIYGADGPASIFGDQERDACALQSDPVSKQPPENPTTDGAESGRDAADLILGGDGVDTVQAGGGNDHVYTYAGDDVACGNAGRDTMSMGTGADLAYGGSDNDTMHGDEGADQVYANTGNDSAWGGEGADRMQGNAGVDTLFGGSHDDLVIGGTSKAGEADDGDRLYGDEGADTLVGDNSDSAVVPAYPADLGTALADEGGNDTVFGGAHADLGYGGLENDHVYGGDGGDQLEGNNASDHVFGEPGADNIIGGSSQEASAGVGRPDAGDTLSGGVGDDVIAGDNTQLANAGSGAAVTKGRSLTTERSITQLDLGHGDATGRFGGDTITGDAANDVIVAQRGVDIVSGNAGDDYVEGGADGDTINGNEGQDDLVGGSYVVHSGTGQATVGQLDAGDTIRGGVGGDVALGDNGLLTRLYGTVTASELVTNRGIEHRAITPFDLGDTPTAGTSGDDYVEGNQAADVVLAQSGKDRVLGGPDQDYAEGGPGSDWLEGGGGSDDLVGGSSTIHGADSGDTAQGQPDTGDVIWGGDGDDLEAGDNAVLTRNAAFHPLTERVSEALGGLIERRSLRLLDQSNGTAGILGSPDGIRFGADWISGQAGVDLALGQDGNDRISGGSHDDYAEGQGGSDTIYGDRALTGVPTAGWPGDASADHAQDLGSDGQDDLLGGSSREGFRDLGDTVYGDGVSDFILGDNGTVKRDIDTTATPVADKVYVSRYPSTMPAGAAKLRIAGAGQSTRFCATRSSGTCEPDGAFGGDTLEGNDGDDFIYGQDGDDTARGGNGDDDMYGEIGDDTLAGNDGDDAILGDRGGIKDVYEDGSASVTTSFKSVPQITYTSRRAGTVSRVVDLHHEVNGDAFVGNGTAAKMTYDGNAFGELDGADTSDRIRGGNGQDSLHGGVGDDLINGDSGGDTVFGADGADVLWGGKGCDAALDTGNAGCLTGGVFDPSGRGTDDNRVDYLVGGKGATSGPSIAGAYGSDILDWRARGSYTPGTGCTTNAWPATVGAQLVDPCEWFEMTEIHNADDADNQHHQGIDWQYGGWDRDVMQADVADNGPNPGDRLIDWTGAYNLYTHCNAAYGGYNDVRQFSPQMQDFLQRWNYGIGAGQALDDTLTAGTSAFIELALTYTEDNREHGNGKAFPSTPGHFDEPNACGV